MTSKSRLRALEQQAIRVVPPEIDPRIQVSLPYVIRRWARRGTGCTWTWDTARACTVDVETGRPIAELEVEVFQRNLRDLDARWRAAGDFHVALRGWCDQGVAWDVPLDPVLQWRERGYARFRRLLGHARTGDTYTLRPGLVVDWSNDPEGEAIDMEDLRILGWTDGLDFQDWRFTYRVG